uniref:WAT1-related protein n=1 Tax=Kalanchoe fedtschenkoi TaxID=63787 RepID=A0A7N0UQR7_KALFE
MFFIVFVVSKTRPPITWRILLESIFCSLFGATLNQYCYFFGLQNTTATIAVAVANTLPAVTFIVTALFRVEKLEIRTRVGQAKVIGTCVCVGGAMLLSFYHGRVIPVPESGVHLKLSEKAAAGGASILGPFLIIASGVAWAFWLMVQTKLSRRFPVPFTSTTMMCFFSSIQCVFVSLIINHSSAAWLPKSGIQIGAIFYAGIVPSAIGFCLMSWTTGKRGPLYVSVFSPLLLIIVAILSWALMNEKLYVGTLLGAVLIVVGLYTVLWGKSKEMEANRKAAKPAESQGLDHLELQMPKADADQSRAPNP